jgi:hypothetical protein
MAMKKLGTGRTKVYLSEERAAIVAASLQDRLIDWDVTVQPSPEKPGAFGVRAERMLSDINENGVQVVSDGRRPLAMIEVKPLPMTGRVGRYQVLWVKDNGLVYLPKEE